MLWELKSPGWWIIGSAWYSGHMAGKGINKLWSPWVVAGMLCGAHIITVSSFLTECKTASMGLWLFTHHGFPSIPTGTCPSTLCKWKDKKDSSFPLHLTLPVLAPVSDAVQEWLTNCWPGCRILWRRLKFCQNRGGGGELKHLILSSTYDEK